MIDHISPFYFTHNNELYNIAICCSDCNFRKGKLIFRFLEEIVDYLKNCRHPLPLEEQRCYPDHDCIILYQKRRTRVPNTLSQETAVDGLPQQQTTKTTN